MVIAIYWFKQLIQDFKKTSLRSTKKKEASLKLLNDKRAAPSQPYAKPITQYTSFHHVNMRIFFLLMRNYWSLAAIFSWQLHSCCNQLIWHPVCHHNVSVWMQYKLFRMTSPLLQWDCLGRVFEVSLKVAMLPLRLFFWVQWWGSHWCLITIMCTSDVDQISVLSEWEYWMQSLALHHWRKENPRMQK